MSKLFSDETLAHYGIPGMKHGVRRWQYEDGRFNEEGKIRYFGKSQSDNKNTIDYIKKDISKINPDYKKMIPGVLNNCAYCSGVYILRRNGQDVSAKYNDIGISQGNTFEFAKSIFDKKNIKDTYFNKDFNDIKTKENSYKKAEKILNKLKDKEASIISIYNAKKQSGGHYLNAEKINNKIYIIDSQSNMIYDLKDFKKEFTGWTIAGVTNINYSDLKVKNINEIIHSVKGGHDMSKLFSDETLAHYGIPGMKHGVRRWQYEDGRFNEEGKIRYFGKKNLEIKEKIKNGLNIIDSFFKNDRAIRLKIKDDIDKDMQDLFVNKNEYEQDEFIKRLNYLNYQKQIYINNLEPKETWNDKFANNLYNKTSKLTSDKIEKVIEELFKGDNK